MNVVNNTRADVIARGVVMGVEGAGRKPAETISLFRVPGNWEAGGAGDNGSGRGGSPWTRSVVG